jgi:hypothetical protein
MCALKTDTRHKCENGKATYACTADPLSIIAKVESRFTCRGKLNELGLPIPNCYLISTRTRRDTSPELGRICTRARDLIQPTIIDRNIPMHGGAQVE